MATFTRFVQSVLLLQLGFSAVSQAGSLQHAHKLHTINHAALHKRALTVTNNIPTNWTYNGCYTEGSGSRALTGKGYNDNAAMTEESCITFCAKNGYFYAGVEYSAECYCGNSLTTGSVAAAAGDCNMACTGDKTEQCGGPNRLNLFHNNATIPPPPPATNAGPAGWGFLGCYTDSVGARTLPNGIGTTGGGGALTVALCTQACQAAGYNISGVEYSGECYCGNKFSNGGAPAPDGLTGCNMLCNGNSSEYCGGANRLDVYALGARSVISPAWSNLGCYTDSTGARTLSYGANVVGGGANMTVENCQAACSAAKYNISGVEYSGECYCDNSFKNGGGPAPDGSAQCNMNCNGNSNEVCGGPNRLNVYSYIGAPPPTGGIVSVTSTSTSTTATSTSTTTSTTTSVTPTPTSTGTAAGIPGNWTYRGCYVDNKYGRILVSPTLGDNQMTIEECVTSCQGQGYSIAGLEYSTQCNCGNAIINGGAIGQDSDCAMTCGGNSSEICGGPNRMSIYAAGNFSTYAPPTAKNSSLPGSWQYQGCLQDVQTRTLPYEYEMPTNLTVEYCLNLCHKFGYGAGGVEYGIQCFCGDDTDRINAGATWLADSSCNMACTGDPTEMCGGGNALNYYTWPNLNNWGQASGNAAGSYQFLIGGVVIPLITSANRNGKVTFVEKHGTGPPNSTGAYELDLSQINNFTAAWRTMNGLQTDVFCSAGLTLPDKAGRQINIGGWSGTSTYGMRFYWPDGSPGVPGVNDWQENPQEIHLQSGRWYPSAMQLVNGSILVVGGEDGSNGAPVPNLEVIPTVGGLVFADWLNRTDPYNLYPFLAVLPSGNIFVAYYNEARILSPTDFSTIKSLPNIPGAVNNPLGGRTYPLEGTSMLLPQSAPYTDPLTVLICGGSTPGPGIAIDNCVTLQPEVPNANWTIERMPSKRVIPSMVALPDGTYLIMNGAMQGTAGFGLANFPNHNALLYDPSKAIGSRITRLANTTIDRLYHNEAILLMDGRVLVSGSDPEDGVHNQEYRVEVFIPPYLMALNEPLALNSSNPINPTYISTSSSSAPFANSTSNSTSTNSTSSSATTCGQRPAFTIASNLTSVAYGQSFQVNMLCGSAAKFSLMGSVSSTHGNSMGQRTIFPAYSCSGTTCTITAPPNGGITGGPGWFMLFALNSNNVPSIAQWIQIGGDPAGLGNWPNYPDFHLPGV